MQLETVQYTAKALAAGGFGLLPRFLVVLFFAAELRAAFESLRQANATQ